MLIAIWDWLFTRRQWKIIKEVGVKETEASKIDCCRILILQDQFGNIKKKTIKY